MRVKKEKIRDKAIEIEEEVLASSWDLHSSDVTFVDLFILSVHFLELEMR